MSGFDFSKFKKMSTDKGATVLKHKDGHTLKIAHGKLSKKLMGELEKLPIHAAEGFDLDASASEQPPEYRDELADLPTMSPEQEKIQEKAEFLQRSMPGVYGSDDELAKRHAEEQTLREAESENASKNSEAIKGQLKQDKLAKEDADYNARAGKLGLPLRNATVKGPTPAQESPMVEEAPTQPMAQAPVAAAPAPQAPAPAPVMAAPVSAVQKPQPTPKQAITQELAQENVAWEHDLKNGHITPKTYGDLFAHKSTLGKIGSIFGLMLSGAGSGLAHQENAVLKMMDNEISRDLDAQKQSKTNAYNFLKLHQEAPLTAAQAGLTREQANALSFATAQTKMLQTSFHQLVENTNKLPEGAQKEAAKQMLGLVYSKMGEKIANINDQAAGAVEFYKTLFPQGAAGDQQSQEQQFQKQTAGMRMLGAQGEKRAVDMEEKHFPGIKGQASLPLNGGDRDKIESGIQFDQKLKRFIDWTKSHSGDLNPKDRYAGQTLAAELQGAYRQATNGGVYKEGEQNFISKLIDSEPTKFFNSIRVVPQLEALSSENKHRIHGFVKSKGFSGYDGASNKDNAMSGVNKGEIEIEIPGKGTAIYDARTKKPLRWK